VWLEVTLDKFLRFIGIVLMGLNAAFTIMSGAGTTCVALAAENYPSMTGIAPYKWLYVIFVIATIAVGVMMARATVMLVKGKPNAYRDTIISLVLGFFIGGIHMAVSRSLRASGSSMPVDAVVYTAMLTLIIFLLFRIPGVWEKVDFTQVEPDDNQKAGGAAAIAAAGLAFSIQYLMASTHTMNGGINYGDAFHTSMTAVGAGLIFLGVGLIFTAQYSSRLTAHQKIATKNEL
jgi:hypothetical protein